MRLLLMTAVLVACAEPVGPFGPEGASCEDEYWYPVEQPLLLDLLVVVEGSPAMAPYQTALADNLGRFAAVLETFQGGMPDLRAGFVAADGTGALRGGDVLSDVRHYDGSRERSYEGRRS